MIPPNPAYSRIICHLTAVNDPRLVGDLRRGRMPGPALQARVRAILEARA